MLNRSAPGARRFTIAAWCLIIIAVLAWLGTAIRRDNPISKDYQYLIALQRADGALCQTPAQEKIVPYFANLTAWALLDYPDGVPRVKAYLEWYLRHLNRPDRWGVTGTIYDYRFAGQAEEPTLDYDSADSYAATFLSLVNQYVKISDDRAFARDHLDALELVAGVLLALQDRDGLLWAKPQYPMKYLMDNCENYRGLIDYAELLQVLGVSDKAERYARHGARVRQGITCLMWDQTNQRYDWALDGKGKPQPFHEGRWYPDGVAQIYPILYGLDRPDTARALQLYAALNAQFPRWTQLDKGDAYPWAMVAYLAALMGDTPRAEAALNSMEQQHVRQAGQPYWYSLEHGFYMRAKRVMGKK